MRMEGLRVVELFSGIGGMNWACQLVESVLNVPIEVVAAVDINSQANAIYKHNHPNTNLMQRHIVGLTTIELNQLRPDVLMMSPPCQPHTRQGQRKDEEDTRSQPLTHIVNILPELITLQYVMVENVQGFEISNARNSLVKSLERAQFTFQEFLISPSQMGVPNSRLRYYLIAKKNGFVWSFPLKETIWQDFYGLQHSIYQMCPMLNIRPTVGEYLDSVVPVDCALEDQLLARYAKILDIVTPDSIRSCCFTKAYSHYYIGTGSVLQQAGDLEAVYRIFDTNADPAAVLTALKSLQMRFLTPKEISRLMGFPEKFSFPPETTRRQGYKALGNSLNVWVVAILLHALLS